MPANKAAVSCTCRKFPLGTPGPHIHRENVNMTGFAFVASALPRVALAMLSGMSFLMLFGDPSPAQQPSAIAVRPGQVLGTIAPAAAVVSTTHYQATVGLSCGGNICNGQFPKPGSKHRVQITRMNCLLQGSIGS